MASEVRAARNNISVRETLDTIWGISTLLTNSVIAVLLIVGGVELNPGPPRRDNSSSEDEIEVPISFDFGDNLKNDYVFTAPVTSTPNFENVKAHFGTKKRPRKFFGRRKQQMKAHVLVTLQFIAILVVKLV